MACDSGHEVNEIETKSINSNIWGKSDPAIEPQRPHLQNIL